MAEEVIPDGVYDLLATRFAPSGIVLWWNTPVANLDGLTPRYAWNNGWRAQVLEEIDRMLESPRG